MSAKTRRKAFEKLMDSLVDAMCEWGPDEYEKFQKALTAKPKRTRKGRS